MRDIITSPRIIEMKRKRRARNTRTFILFLILFISVTGALSYFSNNPRIIINKIVVNGTRIINISDIESHIQDKISGRYFYLFSRSNSLIYPKGQIYNDLINSFPRIEKLSVYKDNINTIHVDISERYGSYLYCGSSIPETESDIGENCYFINTDGYIFDTAPYFSGNVYFKYYVELPEGTNSPLGTQMLSSEKFHEIVRFIDGVTDLGFKPIYLVMGADGNNTLYLDHGSTNSSPIIMWKNDSNLENILSNFTVSMSKKEFADEINSKYTTLLYIDMRFKNKVLYKFSAQGGSASGGQ